MDLEGAGSEDVKKEARRFAHLQQKQDRLKVGKELELETPESEIARRALTLEEAKGKVTEGKLLYVNRRYANKTEMKWMMCAYDEATGKRTMHIRDRTDFTRTVCAMVNWTDLGMLPTNCATRPLMSACEHYKKSCQCSTPTTGACGFDHRGGLRQEDRHWICTAFFPQQW